jgi:CheY-like chemotaxis protein
VFLGPEIELSVEVDSDPGCVRGDAQKLAQVVIDLAANARDAMPHGGKLTIKSGTVEIGYDPHHAPIRPGHYALISMSDAGHGMDQAMQSRIFRPFFTSKPEGRGAGLGLAYARLIIEKQSGGEIRVSSQPGRGSTFTIYLPCVDMGKSSRHSGSKTELRAKDKTVLVVTGDDVLRRLIAEFLGLGGFDVLKAKTAADALNEVEGRKSPISLLLTDVITLGKSGEELASELSSLDRNMKVIYMADYGELAASVSAFTSEGAQLLHKPFLSFELIAKVKSALAV